VTRVTAPPAAFGYKSRHANSTRKKGAAVNFFIRHLIAIEIVLGAVILAGAVYLTQTGTRIPPIAVVLALTALYGAFHLFAHRPLANSRDDAR